MSVLIKGVKLPKSCFGCHLFNLDDQDLWCIANHYAGCCRVLSKYIDENKFVNERHPDCPLIEIKTPHGRLIDKDKFRHDLFVNFNGERIPFYDCDNFPTKISYRDLHSILSEQKTVIESEGET